MELGTALTELLGMMPVQAPDPEQFLACLGKCQKVTNFGVGLGPGFAMKGVMARANEACLHRNWENFCAILSEDSEEVQELLKNMEAKKLRAYVAVEVENRLMGALRHITEDEIKLKASGKMSLENTPNLHEAWNLALAISNAASKQSFLASAARDNARAAHVILEGVDMAALQATVQMLESCSQQKAESLNDNIFFLQHDTGKSLLALASERVQNGEAEAAFQQAREALAPHLKELEEASESISDGKGPPETEGVAAIVSRVEPAANALAAVKQCKFLKTKAAKKSECGEGLSAVDLAANDEKRLQKAVVSVVQNELSLNLAEHLQLCLC